MRAKGVQFYDWDVIVVSTLIIPHYPVYVNTFFDDRIRENEGQHLKFAYQENVVKGVPGSVMSEIIISVSCKGSDGAVLPPCL